ncbi:uroporphyrinogen-III synthase [Primorskyibacter sp. 2E107]|uniref:uroporphyrinogen-III synthase n=1 Tax=Primorskyibacter sp. 2E107 TaxID=3403458 RepID=UPI003AF5F648
MAKPLPILLMTRPKAQAEDVVAALRDAGARFDAIYAPLIGVAWTGAMPEQEGLGGLIFTSANGVRAWAQRGGRSDLPCYAVGGATAAAAADAGLQAISADGNAEDLIALLAERKPEGAWLHVRGVHSRGDVAGRLSAAGMHIEACVLYDQPALEPTAEALDALAGKAPVVAPLYSPRTAALFARLPIKAPLLVAGLSQAVVKPVAALHIYKQKIATRPESDAMLAAVLEMLEFAGESGES